MSKDNSDFFKKKNDWSKVKDNLLGCYIVPYLQKILSTNRPICYVDCFAGKGKFEDNNDGSPLIALKAREKCITNAKLKHKEVEMCFIEANHASELKENINAYCKCQDVDIRKGRYEDIIENLISHKNGYNVFLYIDPYGIKSLDFDLYNKFSHYSCKFNTFEMLINFNSFGFFRAACNAMRVEEKQGDPAFQGLSEVVEYSPTIVNWGNSADMLTKVAGGDYWKGIVDSYKNNKLDGFEAERQISNQYKQKLNENYKYVLDMPIRLKPGGSPKYRMIHVCEHEDGCLLMAKNILSRTDELCCARYGTNQMMLPGFSSGNIYIGKEEIKEKIHHAVDEIPADGIRISKFLAKFLSDNGLLCDFKTIYDMLEEMGTDKKVVINRIPEFKKDGEKTTFWEEKAKKQVILRRGN